MATKAPVKKVRVTASDVAAYRANSKRDHSPKWDGCETWSASKFASHFRDAMKYYNMEHSGKDLKPAVINWMGRSGYTKDQIAAFKKTKDWRCNLTMGAIASCLLRGMTPCRADFNGGKDSAQWLGKEIAKVIEDGARDIDEEAVAAAKAAAADKTVLTPAPSIQERTRETALAMTDELEDAFESFQVDPENFDPKAFKVLNLLRQKSAKAGHARVIKDFYGRELAELQELASGKAEDQLKEAYKHRSRKQVKNFIQFLTEIQSACDMIIEEAKVNRAPRVKKPADKTKLVSKLKYLKQDELTKSVSIDPVNIIGSRELWVYNTKTRKIGKYVAAEFQELGVKGTTITGFDADKSVQKTLRKPVDQLKEFKAAGKIALRKFLDEIKAIDIKLNGRIGEDVLLLKVQ